jgi:flagellar basal body P-ring formation protein FlgA
MIRPLTAAFITLAASSVASAQVTSQPDRERPSLKSEAIVTGEIVRIGDLIDHAGIVANVPIFRAPDPGYTGTISSDTVLEAVRNHALIGVDAGDVRDVVVTRASRTIPAKDIEDAIAQALSARFDLGPSKDIAVHFARDVRATHVDPFVKGEPRVKHIDFDSYSGRFDATIEMPAGGGKYSVTQLSGRVVATVEVATVAQTTERGTTLKDSDVLIERRPRTEIGRGIVTSREQAIGQAARSTLQPGRPLRFTDLMKPDMVQRNEMVTLVYEAPGVLLTTRGKAVEGGAQGNAISVFNEQSKRTVQGTIVGPGRVAVTNGALRVVANNTDRPSGNAGVR